MGPSGISPTIIATVTTMATVIMSILMVWVGMGIIMGTHGVSRLR
jgi:hypothetical protein